MDSNLRQDGTDEKPMGAASPRADERLAYRPAELAALVGLSTKAIYRAIERGELRAVKVANGSRLLIPASATDEWLEVSAVESRSHREPRKPFRADEGSRPLGDALARFEDAPGAD